MSWWADETEIERWADREKPMREGNSLETFWGLFGRAYNVSRFPTFSVLSSTQVSHFSYQLAGQSIIYFPSSITSRVHQHKIYLSRCFRLTQAYQIWPWPPPWPEIQTPQVPNTYDPPFSRYGPRSLPNTLIWDTQFELIASFPGTSRRLILISLDAGLHREPETFVQNGPIHMTHPLVGKASARPIMLKWWMMDDIRSMVVNGYLCTLTSAGLVGIESSRNIYVPTHNSNFPNLMFLKLVELLLGDFTEGMAEPGASMFMGCISCGLLRRVRFQFGEGQLDARGRWLREKFNLWMRTERRK